MGTVVTKRGRGDVRATRRLAGGALAAALLTALTGCGGPVATVEVPPADLEARVDATVRDSLAVDPEVTCPQTLEGSVGATTTCDVVVGDSTAVATVTVTEVTEDDTVHLDIAVDLAEEATTPAPDASDDATEAPAEG